MKDPLRLLGAAPLARLALPAVLLGGCGPSTSDPGPGRTQTSLDVTVGVDLSERHQTLEGFGAAVAWYDNWLTDHPNKVELYDLIFSELGIDILRLRNRFRYQDEFAVESQEIVSEGARSLGRDLTVLMSSWSPPPNLKSSGQTDCTDQVSCTLIREAGAFPYQAFAEYWNDSLDAYAGLGIVPKFISIQNEPDFHPNGWEGCRFDATETAELPGYDRALEAVHGLVAQRERPPLMLGPETIGITRGKVQGYTEAMNLGLLDGIAHHLYDGSTWQSPDDFTLALQSLGATGLPVFQTEFSVEGSDGGAFETAWLIHNSLTHSNAVAYVYWDLIWRWQDGEEGGLVAVEFPDPTRWQSERGYKLRSTYYSVRHFAKFTDPGWSRVGATSSSDALRVSAFVSPNEDAVTVVMLNVSNTRRDVRLSNAFDGFARAIFQSTDSASWQELSVAGDAPLGLPASSVTTLAFTRTQ
jgi:glucuronoarabinoxylan endo-1,4-beta-xylanase